MNNKVLAHRSFALWNSLGVAVEYYDYVVFFLLIPHISAAFFASGEQSFGTMGVFVIAAAGPWARLLSAFIFSYLARCYDLRLVLIIGMFSMAFATFCIGMIPNFSSIGVTSIILLVAFRMIQGMAFAIEMPNSLALGSVYLSKFFGIFTSITIFSATFGGVFAHGVVWLLEIYFSKQQMSEWAWRIPFFLGGLLGSIGFFMRRRFIFASSNFIQNDQIKWSLLELFRIDVWKLVRVLLLWIIPLAMIFNYMSFPYLLAKTYGFTSQSIYPATIFGLVVTALTSIAFGKFTHAFGLVGKVHYHLIFYTLLMTIAWSLLGKSIISVYIFCGSYQMVLTNLMNIASKLSLQVLRAENRVFAIAYNSANALASFTAVLVVPDGVNLYLLLFLTLLLAVYMIGVGREARNVNSVI
jgi:MFS family permease